MQENIEKLYILCGLSNAASETIRSALVDAAQEHGYEAVCVSRYRKEGIRQYLSEHPEFRILVLQEAMQSSYPYTAEELAELMDDYHLNIIVSINKSHRANAYMKVLYTAGILNALYEEDATAKNIMNRILYPRTRKECREYYQIKNTSDALQALEIINEEKMQQMISYLEDASEKEETVSRYEYLVDTMNQLENLYLIDHMSDGVKQQLCDNERFQEICNLRQSKKKWPFDRKKKAKESKGIKQKEKSPPIYIKTKDQVAEEKKLAYEPVEDLIDEDISDLLGFVNSGSEKEINMEDFTQLKDEGDINNASIRTHNFLEKGMIVKGLVIVIILSFIAVTILFGFFLYSERQMKETSQPMISQTREVNTENEVDEEEVEIPEETVTEDDAGSEQEIEKAKDAEESSERTATVAEQSQSMESSDDSRQSKVDNTEKQSQEKEKTVQQNETSYTTKEKNKDTVSEKKATSAEASYQGKIYTGAELLTIAKAEEAKGTKIYIRTRESGEGYFKASQLSQIIDNTCSYLAQGVANGQLTFIEQ